MKTITISILQSDIHWEDKSYNLRFVLETIKSLQGKTEILLLPETFATGFTMNTQQYAESNNGQIITTLQSYSDQFNIAIAGSFIAHNDDENGYYNRAFFISPDAPPQFYDKRHLFRMGNEGEHFKSGDQRYIVKYKDWNILLQVCYDLRFPVWSRNVHQEYDIIFYMANWPSARREAWDILLKARAIENQAFVCASNRTGTDGHGISHNGGSIILSPKGTVEGKAEDHRQCVVMATIDKEELCTFRNKFPAWMDADEFRII